MYFSYKKLIPGGVGRGRAICVTSASPRVARQTERSRSLFSVCLSPPPNGSYHWSIAATVAVVEALKKKEDTETAAAAAGRIAPPALHSVRPLALTSSGRVPTALETPSDSQERNS